MHWDLTSDQRYTVSSEVKDLLKDVKEPLGFTILLEGDLPASFRGYRSYIDYYLGTLRRKYPNIEINYKDPNEGSIQEANEFKSFLRSRGVNGLSRKVAEASEVRQSELFPFLSVHYRDRVEFVDLLESKRANESEQDAIMRSQFGFESDVTRTIRNITNDRLPQVRILGAKNKLLTEGLTRDPRSAGYTYLASSPSDLLSNLSNTSCVIVLANADLSSRALVSIDQTALRGIPIIWFAEKFNLHLDSISSQDPYLAYHSDFNFEDYWFKLGAKIQPSLIYDLSCARIPQVVGIQGGQAKTTLLPFQLHPVISGGRLEAGYSLALSPIISRFTAPIQIIESPFDLASRVLLTTSPYVQVRNAPITLSFDMLRVEPRPEDYNQGPLPIAIETKGVAKFQYEHRMSTEDREWLQSILGNDIVREGEIQQTLITDSDIIVPPRGRDGAYSAIGFDIWERRMFDGNFAFLMNLLELNIHGDNLLQLSQREMSNPVLDINQYNENKNMYTFLLLGLPILILLITYWIYQFFRKRKYANPIQ